MSTDSGEQKIYPQCAHCGHYYATRCGFCADEQTRKLNLFVTNYCGNCFRRRKQVRHVQLRIGLY